MLISGMLGADGVKGTGDANFCSVTSGNKAKSFQFFIVKHFLLYKIFEQIVYHVAIYH